MSIQDEVEISIEIPDGLSGNQLRNLLLRFQRFHGSINEIRDSAQFEKDLLEIYVDATKSAAFLIAFDDKETYKTDVARKAAADHIEVDQGQWSLDDNKKNLIEMKKELAVAVYRVRRAASRLKELENAIDSLRSALAWDRREYERGES